MTTLLEKIASLENVEKAFQQCLSGKRGAIGAQKIFLRLDSEVLKIRTNILLGEGYPWGKYRSFFVHDPKRRQIFSAPFIDRVTHRAIYNVIDPILNNLLLPCTFACRTGFGNGRAVAKLMKILERERDVYIVKLDVKKYFESICHRRLMAKLRTALPDDSAEGLMRGLLKNHPKYSCGTGLPLGNVTSQSLANFYLNEIDHFVCSEIGDRYVRYMDDQVIVARSQEEARRLVHQVVRRGKKEKLTYPQHKRIWIGSVKEVPFLGFLITPKEALPLNRNRRRYQNFMTLLKQKNVKKSYVEMRRLSYDSWSRGTTFCKKIPMNFKRECANKTESGVKTDKGEAATSGAACSGPARFFPD